MNILKTIRNYFFYCGIEKDEYNALKKDAYISNYVVWRVLHILMIAVFAFLLISSMMNDMLEMNRVFYLIDFCYSAIATLFFFFLKSETLYRNSHAANAMIVLKEILL